MSEYDAIPQRMMESMKAYVLERREPGHFLKAVISNDLVEAVGRADNESMASLRSIVRWFYNKAPANCWGSKERMTDWLNDDVTGKEMIE